MDRDQLVELAYQRGKELSLSNSNYASWLREFFDQEFREDVGPGDLTSEAILTQNKHGKAIFKAKKSGTIAGVEESSWFLQRHNLKAEIFKEDADEVNGDESILEVHGVQRDILDTERIALNILQRMSGIATETRSLVDSLKGYKTRIAATRKTHLRYLDKKAVFLGGGLTHRLGLWDSILIKDNHLEALRKEGMENPIEEAIVRTSKLVEGANFIEIEVTNQKDAVLAGRKFMQMKLNKPCIIMLDNMGPQAIEQTLHALKDRDLYDYALLEASGNITPKNIKRYAKTGIDVVSLGYLTHSAQVLDMSLEMTE